MSGKWGADHSHLQRHVSFAVAYNVWRYYEMTHDTGFLIRYGAEILLSIAQFVSSLAEYDYKDKRYHTQGIMGPDEFHEKLPGAERAGFKDNAYSNILIVWLLLKARKAFKSLPPEEKERILVKLALREKDLARWHEITRRMKVIINKDGIISQFDGYFKLKELNWGAYRKKYNKIQRMDRILKAEGKSPNDYKVAKQADVLMMFYLLSVPEVKGLLRRLGYKFDRNILRKNYEYYVKRTSHGSTLSKVVHCYIAHLLGKLDEAFEWYLEVLKSDIYDTQGGTTPEGIHAGVMAGSIYIATKAFAGLSILEDQIKINPSIPSSWRAIKLRIRYKENWIFLTVRKNEIDIFIRGPKSRPFPTPIEIYGKRQDLLFGKAYKISRKKKGLEIIKRREVLMLEQERILIVDSDIGQTEILASRLEAMGYLVVTARKAKEALDILGKSWIDLIVVAVVLRGTMDGFQLFKEVRGKKKFSELPIIVQSKKPAMRDNFMKAGAAAFFTKPYSVDRFLTKVKNILTH